MRTQHEATFDQSCAVKRKSASEGATGGTESWSTVATVNCHIREESRPSETMPDGSIRSHTYFVVWLPYGTNVLAADRLTIGSYTYEVTGFDSGKSYPLNVQARCVRVEGVV